LRKAAIFSAIVLVLILAGLSLAPQFIDLGRLKAPIAAALSERIGRPVELAGPIGLSLLPSPLITLRDVRLANPSGTAVSDMVRLRALEVKPALLALLSGRIAVSSATLVEPEIDLERRADGTGNWQGEGAPAASAGAAHAAAQPAAAEPLVAVDRVAIQNGAITDRTGAVPERFEHINARVAVDPASGKLAADGTLVARGAEVSFELEAGRLDAAELPLRLVVSTKPAARLELEAVLSGRPEDRRVTGTLKLKAEDARAALGTLARFPVPSTLAEPAALSADIGGTLQELALDHLALDLGPLHGEGSFHLAAGAPAGIGLALSFGRLDLDHWPAPRRVQSPLSLLAMAAAAATAASQYLPSIKAEVDLGVEAMLWRSGLIRDARLKFALAEGRVAVSRLSASLPGGSELMLSGTGTPAIDAKAEGVAELNSDDLRGLLAWLGANLERVPADRLRKTTLSSRFTLSGNRIDFSPIDATLDGTKLGGAATLLLRTRLGIGLRLAADRLNLDAYLPAAAPAATTAAAPGAPAAAAPVAAEPASSELPFAFDANVDLRVGTLAWRGQPLREVHLAGSMENDEASIRELSVGDAGGATATLSGVVDGLGGNANGQLAFDMHGPELERFLRLIAPSLASGRSYGAFSLGGGMQYDGGTLTLDAELQLLEGRMHVLGDIADAGRSPDLGLELDHPSFLRLVKSIDPFYAPAGGDPGPVKLTARLGGQWRRLRLEHIALALGASTLEGTLGFDLDGAKPHVSADLTIGDWAIDKLISARQSAALEEGAVRLGKLGLGARRLCPFPLGGEGARGRRPRAGGGLGDGSIKNCRRDILGISAKLPAGDAATLRVADLPLKGGGGRSSFILAQAQAPAAGEGWSAAPIELGALALVDADVALTGKSLAFGRWRIEAPALAAQLAGGKLTLSRLAGSFLGGSLEASGTLDASPALAATVALRHGDFAAALAAAAGKGLLDGSFDLDASVAAAGGSEAELVGHLSGEAALTGHDGTIAGVNLKAMNDALAQHPADIFELFKSGGGGRTRFSTLEGRFHVADGIARSDEIRLAAEGGEVSANLGLDLPRWTMTGAVEFRLAGAADAPPLIMHLDGAIDQPRMIFEINALEKYLADRAATAKAPPK